MGAWYFWQISHGEMIIFICFISFESRQGPGLGSPDSRVKYSFQEVSVLGVPVHSVSRGLFYSVVISFVARNEESAEGSDGGQDDTDLRG